MEKKSNKIIKSIISELRNNGVRLQLKDQNLELVSHKKKLDKSLIDKVRENKIELIKYLEVLVNDSKPTSIPLTDKGSDYALSSAQRRLWIVSQHKVANVAYNVPMAFVFDGTLDRSSLSNSFKSLIARHEILRTVFVEKGGVVRQIVKTADELGFELGYKDLQGEKNPDALVKGYVNEDFTSSFDLASGPLLRAGLYRLGHDRWLFTYVMHHIISDGWSMDILIKELFHLYDCYKGGKSTSFPELRIQYKDYAEWQQGCLKEDTLDSHRTYWLKQFEGELPVLELPAKGLRPPIKTFIGATVTENLSPELSDAIKSLCQENGCTLFMGLLAGVNALLFRYTGQNDIVLGSPIAGREHSDLENQIGFYVNTLALRTRFQASESYLDLLGHVRKVTLEAYQHQAFPFDELVTALKLRQDVSRNPLFDGWVVLHNENEAKFSKSIENRNDLKLSRYLEIEQSVSRRDLTYTFIETSKGIELSLGYNSDIYSGEFVEQMARHFVQLMSSIISGAGERICDLDYLNEFEKREILFDFNQSSSEQVEENSQTVLDLFSEQVEKTPDNTAVVFENIRLTYRELDQISDYLNNYLVTTYDVQSGDLVGIKLERSEWMIVSILSVLKSGAAYVPIDVDYPEDRIAYMIEDSQCKVMIDQMELTKFQENKEDYRVVQRKVEISPKSLAYVIYTSGSTGKPKGVMIKHLSLFSFLSDCLSRYKVGYQIKMPFIASHAFDISIFQFMLPLLSGGVTEVLSQEVITDIKQLVLKLQSSTSFDTVPALMNQVILEIKSNGNKDKYDCILDLFIGGDLVPNDLLKEMRETFLNARINVTYGPTEGTVFVSSIQYTTGLIEGFDGSIIGKPSKQAKVYIIDDFQHLVPNGVTGEICIGGDILADGYLNQTDLTKNKFVFNKECSNSIIYKTGDTGKWLTNGFLQFRGRKDNQVKIRGYRIELGEIQKVAQDYPDISNCIAVVESKKPNEKELVLYIVSPFSINISNFRSFLKRILTNYMIPSQIIRLEYLPLTPNGKFDRKRLRGMDALEVESNFDYVHPRNDLDEKFVALWEEILGQKRIGIKDNFFEIGGDSIKIIRLAKGTSEIVGEEVPISFLFQYACIQDLTDFISERGNEIFEEEDFNYQELINDLTKFE